MEADKKELETLENDVHSREYLCKDLYIETVTVYLISDQAEISRKIKVTLDRGVTLIKLLDVSQSIVLESIRVEPGNEITLLDVTLKERDPSENKNEHEFPEIDKTFQMKADLARQKKYQAKLSSKLDRLMKQQTINNSYLESLLHSSKCSYDSYDGGDNLSTSKCKTFTDMVQDSGQMLEKLTSFFEQYETHASRLEDQIDKMKAEIDAIAGKISKTQSNLDSLETEASYNKSVKDLFIKVQSSKECDKSISLYYVVNDASWKPHYDIRVSTGDKVLAMSYDGFIDQSTGEDWTHTRLSLSPGTPVIGCKIPNLGTQKLALLKKKEESDINKSFTRGRFMSYRKNRKDSNQRSSTGMDIANESTEFLEDDERTLAGESMTSSVDSEGASYAADTSSIIESSPKQFKKENLDASQTTLSRAGSLRRRKKDFKYNSDMSDPNVSDCRSEIFENLIKFKESMSNAMYEIKDRVTVKSGLSEKVTIANVSMDANLVHESAPRKSPNAYLKAYVENNTSYIFVEGAATIFLNGIFVSKTNLKHTCLKEKFSCQLGVDSSVHIDYKPLCKYREHVGILSKNITLSYKQIIEVKNTQCRTIQLIITDHVPISTDEKIKVSLLEPSIKNTERYDSTKTIRLNRYNNIEWDLELKPSDERELILKYTVEHPVNEDVDLLIS